MSSNTNLRKQLKAPDAFQVQMASLLNKGVAAKKWLLAGVSVLLVIILAATIYRSFVNKALEARRTELSAIDLAATDEDKAAEKKRDAWQKQVDQLRKQLQPPADAKGKAPANPNAEKIKADIKQLEDQMAAVNPDHAGSAAQYQKFYEKYPKDPEGWVAGLRAASYQMDTHKTDEARKILSAVLADSKDHVTYQMQAGMMLISIDEDAGKYDDALKTTDTLLMRIPEDLKPKVLLTKGRLQLMKKSNAEAKTTLDTLIEKHGNTPEADQARSFKALIN